MSINMTDPRTPLEMLGAAANYLEQMFIAKMVNDDQRFKYAHNKAGLLLFELQIKLEELNIDDHGNASQEG